MRLGMIRVFAGYAIILYALFLMGRPPPNQIGTIEFPINK